QISTVRSFEGGLNVTDTDLNMSPKYAKVLDNIERSTDGSLTLRPATRLLTNKIADTSEIINCVYFNALVWTVQASGNICTVDGAGNVVIQSAAAHWTPGITFVDFTIFSGDLLMANGKDKPLIVSTHPNLPIGGPNPDFNKVAFLRDLGHDTNVNTPIGKYIIAHGRFTVIAGVASAPSTIFISHEDTSGTFFGDGAPNNGVNIDLGPRVSLGGA